jgi:hypothetical protein
MVKFRNFQRSWKYRKKSKGSKNKRAAKKPAVEEGNGLFPSRIELIGKGSKLREGPINLHGQLLGPNPRGCEAPQAPGKLLLFKQLDYGVIC